MSKASEVDKDFVLIIGAGELVMPAFRIAREELGLGTVALDINPDATGMLYADKAIQVSTKDAAAAVELAKQVSQECRLKGVFTCGADVEITVAAVAAALGLPGIRVEVAERCNDKVKMHEFLDSKGFTDKARYRLVNDIAETRRAADEVGFPCVFKPIDNCASRGIQRLDRPEIVEEAYALAIKHNSTNGRGVLVEECLVGTKHTVEMIAWQGKWHLLSVIDTHYISPRWPCEVGLNTSSCSTVDQNRMFKFAEHVARIIGIDFGAHKIDINMAPDGNIKLIELTARLSGGFHCQCASPLAFGSHDIRAALKLAIGQPIDGEDIRHRYSNGAAVRAIFPRPGRIVSISGVEQAKSAPGIHEVFVWRKVGDVVGPYYNSADRPAFVIGSGRTTAEAVANVENAVNLIRIETDSL